MCCLFVFRPKSASSSLNGSTRRSCGGGSGGGSAASSPISGVQGRPITSLLDGGNTHHSPSHPHHVLRVVVNMDEKGYGMKVSGDNPVYVQSVKEGNCNKHFFVKKYQTRV